MKMQMALLLTCLVTISIGLPYVESSLSSAGDINWWCNQTPNPEPCKYYMSHSSEPSKALSRKQFLTLAEQTALDRVTSELGLIRSLEPKLLNNAERSAWSQCLQFHHLTVNALTKILDVNRESTAADIQIWLSGASTNIRTCHQGFFDVKLTTNIYPIVISNNVTELITNCMAVNKNLFDEEKATNQPEFYKSFPANNSLVENADCVVAQDGSGDYKTISEALQASVSRRQDVNQRFVIQVKQGTYAEYPVVTDQMKNIMIVGEGMGNTIVTGNAKGATLIDSATFKVYGEGFVAQSITFENTAGASAGQEIALFSQSDQSAYYQCRFKGYQDTLLTGMNRQFYRECEIYGTVDYIFGNAAVVFQKCVIYAGVVTTAQGRTSLNDPTGTVIQNCRIVSGPELPAGPSPAYLGRPWLDYSTVVVMQSFLDSVVNPAGWLEWPGAAPGRYSTLFYAEFNNNGPGSATDGRVKWPGYHIITDASQVQKYSVANFIAGNSWLPATGVPFDSGI
ncbi:Pectinesterase [Heracleum sosnowskyi]|uniref:Pectinesterase n=1 Tax=Heracleum sosnowskyi TaxID=360622 RepID=A0AAD8IJV4_9APIA|nr:Pectinesterase [Heracleum sosnowskyi]